jgi:hypothetical protein
MGKQDHAIWDESLAKHEPKDNCGCIWRHCGGWDKSPTPCHYAMNSYKALSERKKLYNNNNKQRAIDLKYIDENTKSTDYATAAVAQGRKDSNTTKSLSQFLKQYLKRHFNGPLHWLVISEKGWDVGYTIDIKCVPKNQLHKGPRSNFLPYKRDELGSGWGNWYPYYHEHHHIFTQGTYRDYVIYGTDIDIEDRIKITIASEWNINHKSNVIMLPEEIMVARIVQLPAHKYWGQFGHKDYSLSIKDDLREILNKMNEAVKEKKPCEKTDIKLELKQMLIDKSIMYYKKIMAMGKSDSIDSLVSLME